MKINKGVFVLAAVITLLAFTLIFELSAHADTLDQTTSITFSESVEIPGRILPAGTYLFRLANVEGDRNIVQIFNSDGTALYATLMTIPIDRAEPTGHTTITLAEQGAGKRDVLLKWFYPGSFTGHEFVYSKQEAMEFAQDKQETIVVNQQIVPNFRIAGEGR